MSYTDKYEVLKKYFGYSSFRDGQEKIIDSIANGRDVLCVMPTGAGKSICYQIPALMSDGITLVISPLISLMKDQVNSLTANGINGAYINSSLTYGQYRRVLEDVERGVFKILYAAPERLLNEEFTAVCKKINISMIAVDEAHCVSQWGQDFRPSYLKIAEFVKLLDRRPVISAFTATATKAVKEDIENILELRNPFKITTGFDRPNLFFSVKNVPKGQKDDTLLGLLSSRRDSCGIVYCATRNSVNEVTELLCSCGIKAARYHAGLTDAERKNNQNGFVYDKFSVMVATNAFGMGIDKSNVSFVIHYNMPKNIESYYQEAGRAGRDGSKADCILIYSPSDVSLNKFLIDQSEPNENMSFEEFEQIRKRDLDRLKYMTWYCTTGECLRHYILNYFGEKSPEYCNNCGNCLLGFEIKDITVDAQKILSCVARMKKPFGIGTVCDVLRGSKAEKIRSYGFDKLSTYGIMKDISEKLLRSEINELIMKEYLISEGEKYPVLLLADNARNVLFKNEKVLMKVPETKIISSSYNDGANSNQPILTTKETSELFEFLKQIRAGIAAEKHMPAYIIFSNSTLLDISIKRPLTIEDFMDINGVGKVKAQMYGEIFIDAVNEFMFRGI